MSTGVQSFKSNLDVVLGVQPRTVDDFSQQVCDCVHAYMAQNYLQYATPIKHANQTFFGNKQEAQLWQRDLAKLDIFFD